VAEKPKVAVTEVRPASREGVSEKGGYSPSEVVSLLNLPAPSRSPAPGTPVPSEPMAASPAPTSSAEGPN
jgi:hypothetical protein